MTAISDGRLQRAAIPLHWEGPIAPDGAHSLDTIRDMQKGMYCEGTCGDAIWVVLIVNANIRSVSNHQNLCSIAARTMHLNLLLIFLHPMDEACPNLLNLGICDLELKTNGQETDQADEMLIIFIFESPPQQYWS